MWWKAISEGELRGGGTILATIMPMPGLSCRYVFEFRGHAGDYKQFHFAQEA